MRRYIEENKQMNQFSNEDQNFANDDTITVGDGRAEIHFNNDPSARRNQRLRKYQSNLTRNPRRHHSKHSSSYSSPSSSSSDSD